MTLQDLDKQDACKHLLESPAPLVVGRLLDELRRYIKHYGVLSNPPGIGLIDEDRAKRCVCIVEELKTIKRSPIDEDVIDELLKKYEV